MKDNISRCSSGHAAIMQWDDDDVRLANAFQTHLPLLRFDYLLRVTQRAAMLNPTYSNPRSLLYANDMWFAGI
jgi:hypothetical protein